MEFIQGQVAATKKKKKKAGFQYLIPEVTKNNTQIQWPECWQNATAILPYSFFNYSSAPEEMVLTGKECMENQRQHNDRV